MASPLALRTACRAEGGSSVDRTNPGSKAVPENVKRRHAAWEPETAAEVEKVLVDIDGVQLKVMAPQIDQHGLDRGGELGSKGFAGDSGQAVDLTSSG